MAAARPKAALFSPEKLAKSPAKAGKPSSAEIASDAAASLVAPPRTISDITAILEQKQPMASRLVRLHQYYWLRMWLESGALGKAGNLPVTSEDVKDHIFTVGHTK